MESCGIGWAVDQMRRGRSVTRRGWNGPGQFLMLHGVGPPGTDDMSLPYIYITTVQGNRVPWLASQTDILATDWEIVA